MCSFTYVFYCTREIWRLQIYWVINKQFGWKIRLLWRFSLDEEGSNNELRITAPKSTHALKKTWWMHVLILEFVLYFILHKQCLCIEFKLQNLEYEKNPCMHAYRWRQNYYFTKKLPKVLATLMLTVNCISFLLAKSHFWILILNF